MSKFTLSGLVALCLAILFWAAERTFYNGVDANGVLQESAFIPLTVLAAGASIVLLAAGAIRSVMRRRS